MHGFKGDLGYTEENLLNQLAHRLNDQGLATLRFDFAGCGKSDGQFSDMTVLSELQDGMKIIDYARQEVQAKEIILVGHSQGGVVASMLAAYYRDVIDKLVLLAPAATDVYKRQGPTCRPPPGPGQPEHFGRAGRPMTASPHSNRHR